MPRRKPSDKELENDLVEMYAMRSRLAGTRFDEKTVRKYVRMGIKDSNKREAERAKKGRTIGVL